MTDHNVVTIAIAIIEELRTQATEVVRRLEEIPSLEVIITRDGKPCTR
jgi:antitoxin (DNA-binding transcriptional repressor) of toxin-antitoxin stability system